jgi:mono/diheme cytochrome c family protein
VSLFAAYGLARGIHREAIRSSHQQPTPEDWLDAPAATSPALVAQGRTAFLASCAHCHGIDASGDEGPDLHGLEASDRYILNTILRGVKGEMPSFRKKLRSADIAVLTAYLRSLK